MFITILGSAAKQDANRECVSVLAESGYQRILFDVGPGIVASLCRAHRKASEVNNVILTHVHGDHILGFAYFIFTRNGEIKALKDVNDHDYTLNVYGCQDTISLAQIMLNGAYPGMKLLFKINYVAIDEINHIAVDNSITLDFVPAIHAVPTISSIIHAEGKKVVYSSDTLPNEDLQQLAQDADFLIHEGMYTHDNYDNSRRAKHSTSLDAGEFAASIHPKHLVLVHVAAKMFGNEKKMLSEVFSNYKGVTSIPYDGSVYVV